MRRASVLGCGRNSAHTPDRGTEGREPPPRRVQPHCLPPPQWSRDPTSPLGSPGEGTGDPGTKVVREQLRPGGLRGRLTCPEPRPPPAAQGPWAPSRGREWPGAASSRRVHTLPWPLPASVLVSHCLSLTWTSSHTERPPRASLGSRPARSLFGGRPQGCPHAEPVFLGLTTAEGAASVTAWLLAVLGLPFRI